MDNIYYIDENYIREIIYLQEQNEQYFKYYFNMSFKTAPQASASINDQRKLYTGVTDMNLVICNPSAKQLAMLYNTDEASIKAPNYKTDNGTRLDFYLQKEEPAILTKMSIFIDDNERVSNTTQNKQFINNAGQSCWAPSIESIRSNSKMEWFLTSSARVAKGGEVTLYDFLCTVFNIAVGKPETDVMLSSWQELLKGNAAEINDLIKYFKETHNANSVKVLLGVKDGKYQDVYTGAFIKATSIRYDYAMKAANNTLGGGFKSYFANSDVFQEFKEEIVQQNDLPSSFNTNMPNPWASSESELKNPFAEEEPTKQKSIFDA